ncbi:hypothetical protein DVP38_11920 [Yersinia enterocolitica]|nr:hypothetical protein [Yersinia enterocolitica]EKN6057508.1 hypothetical protein [Yersinia enterocolitica]EKN6227744.1 hypothetical protein [Yersinia enterocolitica]EKN6271148.1 hypothetical protein [Yersinia enterocolitica]CNF70236.1 Uncharacterised protein [Yersinia enterocolitica]
MTENCAFVIALLVAYIPFGILELCGRGCSWADLKSNDSQMIKRNGPLYLAASIVFFIILLVVPRCLMWAFV